MALNSGRILMRGGNEANFDADKMMPREWAVSTDKRIVRICFAPGVCIRMATYDAFEEDMAEVQEILENCQNIEEAVIQINTKVSENADAVVEYTNKAKLYRDEAEIFKNEAKTSAEMAEAIKNNDYTYALNKPKINNVELIGNKTLKDIGIHTVANLFTTEIGKILDATMGKELNDKIEAIPKIVFSTTEPETISENTIVMVYEE